MPQPASGVTAFYLVMANRPNKDYVLATVMYGRSRAPGEDGKEVTRLAAAQIEFFSRFRDGSQVCTDNGKDVPGFPSGPMSSVAKFPMIEDAVKLYRVHRALLEKHQGTSTKFLRVDEFQGDVGAYLGQVVREQLDEKVTAGYFYFSEEEGVYRPTLKGAYLMTWRQLQPFKGISKTRIRSKALELMRELDESPSS